MVYYSETTANVLKELKSSEKGLTAIEADRRERMYGENKLAEGKKVSLAKRFLQQLKDPMLIILIVAAVISGITAFYAHDSYADVIIIMVVVLLNSILGVYQESKAEKAIEALKKMTEATCKVMRDGTLISIPSTKVVPGDIIVLEAGDAVPADGRILDSKSMKIEEAALTGESVPVDKIINSFKFNGKEDVPLGDRKNMAYMGSTVVYGRGKIVVTGTGMKTEMGKIATALTNTEESATPLQRKLAQLGKTLSWVVLGICVFIFAFSLLKQGSFTFDTVLSTFMIAVSLAVAAIPEGLATVVTVVLSIGVTNMSKRNAVIRRLTAVETLGCAQIICSDKTGTLTQNKMTVVEHYGNKELIARAMCLCNDATLYKDNEAKGEPTESALVNFAFKCGIDKNKLEKDMPRVSEVPFDSKRKMMSTVHSLKNGVKSFVQYTKGAPDEILKKCTHYLSNGKMEPMTSTKMSEILRQNKSYADKALRVLGCAYKYLDEKPSKATADSLEKDLIFVGLVGMIDPIRPEVLDSIKECRDAGIKPIMITGDHKDTAVAIAKELGIINSDEEAITGLELNRISDKEFEQKIEHYSVYARVQPEHKVRIVKAWKQKGYVTAMTGDGVNDAPSIKNADIGVGMGITGTDVTKNVADMVLADDNFSTIVNAVEEGRRIYDNIRKSIQFLLASNMSEVLGIFLATLFGFVLLEPVHLLWINLITDCFPALALGMEKGEPNLMKRKPRNSKDGIFSGGVGFDIIYQGLLVTAVTLIAYFVGHYMEAGVWQIANSSDGMTMAFLTMSMAEIFHSFNMRSQRQSLFSLKKQNFYLLGAMILSLALTTSVLYVPFLRQAFSFEHISLQEYFVALALAFSVIPIVEIVKLIQRSFSKDKVSNV